MSNISIRATMEPVRSIAFGSISGTYAGIGTALSNPSRMLVLQNFTDQPVMISIDGVSDHLPLAANVSMIMDMTSNKSVMGAVFAWAEGQRFYVKTLGAGPASGSIYLSTIYGTDF